MDFWPSLNSACVGAKLLQWCLTLCNLMHCSPPGSTVLGILQARILELVSMLSSRGTSRTRDQTCISCGSCIAGSFFSAEALGKPSLNNSKGINQSSLGLTEAHFLHSTYHMQMLVVKPWTTDRNSCPPGAHLRVLFGALSLVLSILTMVKYVYCIPVIEMTLWYFF